MQEQAMPLSNERKELVLLLERNKNYGPNTK